MLQTIQTILSDRSPSWAFQYQHAVWNLPAYTPTHPHTRARTHTNIPVGGGGSASYYQLIFAVLFLLQRVVPYVSLSATAFNLLLVSAVKTSYLNSWFDGGEYREVESTALCTQCVSQAMRASHVILWLADTTRQPMNRNIWVYLFGFEAKKKKVDGKE